MRPCRRHGRIWLTVVAVALAGCGDDVPTSDVPAPPASTTTVITTTIIATTAPATTTAAPTTTSPGTTTAVTTAVTTVPTQEEPMEPEPTMPPARPSIVEDAIADLRRMLSDPTADIEVVSVEEVDWPDGSIGCPQPGMVYTQAIVNGSRIVLRHDGVDYAYHQGGGRDVFHCPPGRAAMATPPPADPDV